MKNKPKIEEVKPKLKKKFTDLTGGIIKFPSLILWIVMYHIYREGNPIFQEPTRFHMWRFKPFSRRETLQELENGKVLLENCLQQLKVRMTRWRVPQNIRRNLPVKSHIQLELDHTSVWYMQRDDSNIESLDYYPSIDQIFQELSRQAKTKIPVPVTAKQIDFYIEEPLTDQEKKE